MTWELKGKFPRIFDDPVVGADQHPELEAAGGEFDVARWASSDGDDFGSEPVDPEVIAERWNEIEGLVNA